MTRKQLLEEVIKLSTTGDERQSFAGHHDKRCYQCLQITERIRRRFHSMSLLIR